MNTLFTYSLFPLITLSIWWMITAFRIFSPLLFPRPEDVIATFLQLLIASHNNIWNDLAHTFVRILIGIITGTCVGLPLGLLVGYYPMLRRSCMPWIDFVRSIPVTALLPLFLLLFGLGDSAKIALAGFIVALLLIVHTSYGVIHANPTRLMIANTMSLTPWNIFRHVLFPEALPYIAVGMRLAISFAIIIVIVSEMFVGTRYGLGLRIIESQLVYATSDMYATIIITGMLGYILNRVYIFFEKRTLHWVGK